MLFIMFEFATNFISCLTLRHEIFFFAPGRNRSRVISNRSVALTTTPYRLKAEVSGIGNISATDSRWCDVTPPYIF